jgi:hypothetical protein
MTVEVLSEILICRPCRLVASFAANPANAPAWYAGVDAVEWRTPPPIGLGARFAFVAHSMGRRLPHGFEVVEFERGRRVVMRSESGPFPLETTYAWEAVGDATKMTLEHRGDSRGLASMVASVVAPIARRACAVDLRTLKQLLEQD